MCVARPGIGFGISCRVEWMAGDDFKLLLVAVETRDGWREKGWSGGVMIMYRKRKKRVNWRLLLCTTPAGILIPFLSIFVLLLLTLAAPPLRYIETFGLEGTNSSFSGRLFDGSWVQAEIERKKGSSKWNLPPRNGSLAPTDTLYTRSSHVSIQ